MARVVRRVLAYELVGDSRHLLLRLHDGDAGLQPSDSDQPLLAAAFEASEVVAIGIGGQRYPQTDVIDTVTIEACGRDAHHRERPAVQTDRSSDDALIAVE